MGAQQSSHSKVTCIIRPDKVEDEIELMFDTPHPFGINADDHVEAAIFNLAERIYAKASAMGIEVLTRAATLGSAKAQVVAKHLDAREDEEGNLLIQFALKDDVHATAFRIACC